MSSAELRENRTLGRSASGDGRKGGPVTVPTTQRFAIGDFAFRD
jgi:hypothetical protein